MARRVTVRDLDGRGSEFVIDVAEDGAIHVEPGGVFTAIQRDAHSFRMTSADSSVLVTAVRDRDVVWLFANGITWRVQVDAGPASRRSPRDQVDASLSAPMPATVAQVRVEVGQAVKQGDTLIVLEAMKMELSIRAPRTGRVTAIRCHAGELVQPGMSLLDLE